LLRKVLKPGNVSVPPKKIADEKVRSLSPENNNLYDDVVISNYNERTGLAGVGIF
jgi:hypothetical protein